MSDILGRDLVLGLRGAGWARSRNRNGSFAVASAGTLAYGTNVVVFFVYLIHRRIHAGSAGVRRRHWGSLLVLAS